MTKEELRALAAEALNGFDGYDGYGDDMVDFDGNNKSFAAKVGAGRIFTITIASAADATKTVILNQGYSNSENPAGSIVLAEGTVTGITTTGSPKSFNNLRDFTLYNPTLVNGFKIRARNSATQLENQVTIQELTPFKTPSSRVISLSAYQDENTYQDKVVTVPEQFILSNQTLVYTQVLAGETITVTLFCSAILNTALSLQKKSEKAARKKA